MVENGGHEEKIIQDRIKRNYFQTGIGYAVEECGGSHCFFLT
jgi:hypothetical protein